MPPERRSNQCKKKIKYNENNKNEKNTKKDENKKSQTIKIKPKIYRCHHCGRTCGNTTLLNDHIRIHTGEKPFLCLTCQKCFRTSDQLRRHNRTHTGEKPYKCPICLKRFAAPQNLLKHRLVHTQIKAFSCSTCNKSFTQKANLQAHIRGVHLKIPYSPRIWNTKKKTEDVPEDTRAVQSKHESFLKNGNEKKIRRHMKLDDREEMHAKKRKPAMAIKHKIIVQPKQESVLINGIDKRIRTRVKLEDDREISDTKKRKSPGVAADRRVVLMQPKEVIVVKNETYMTRGLKQEYDSEEDDVEEAMDEDEENVKFIERLKFQDEEWQIEDYKYGEIEFLEDWDQFEDEYIIGD